MSGMRLLGHASTVKAFERMKEWAGDDDVVYIVGTNVEYAAYVEFGTSRQQAQPYLRPAAEKVAKNPERYVDGNPDSVEAYIRQVALAIEREATEKAPVDTGNLQNSIRAQRVR